MLRLPVLPAQELARRRRKIPEEDFKEGERGIKCVTGAHGREMQGMTGFL